MAILSNREQTVAEAIGQIGYCNPFLPSRLALEKRALGSHFQCADAVINLPPNHDVTTIFANFTALRARAEVLTDKIRSRLANGHTPSEQELGVYQDLVLYLLYNRNMAYLDTLASVQSRGATIVQKSAAWKAFLKDFEWYLRLPGVRMPPHVEAGHCFAVFFQIQRAFNHIFECIVGRSMPIARLRAAVWESIFTHDMGRYSRAVYKSMGDIPTLITGNSGTGKELIARAIGMSRYIPFNLRTERFDVDSRSTLHSVNLSALSPTLIESELFGHRKGAFTGAVSDREGWLELSGPQGTVFLDEIGELNLSIQVKLLRVLQCRSFCRVGETQQLQFSGKIVAATNRDLSQEMASQRFREDLYFRLCADMIHTPTLREQIADRADDLEVLTQFIASRVLSDLPDEASALARETVEWVETHLGINYAWPGNIRELEQCVRNVMIRKSYTPAKPERDIDSGSPRDRLAHAVKAGQFSLEELTQHYVSLIYAAEGRYDQAAARLGMDWRTLKQKLNAELVNLYSDQ